MNLCSDGHEEVCFDASGCPACEVAEERDSYEEDLKERDQELKDIQRKYTELEQLVQSTGKGATK